jgi:hypothetical protein
MKLLVNFATPNFFKAQQFNRQTALQIGGFDQVFCANPHLIDAQFKQKYQSILNETRGAGYWLWKPYFILQKLRQLADGDLLIYTDSASHFIHSAAPLLELPQKFDQDIIPFELELIESAWTKRDAFVYMDADHKEFENTRQFLASFMVIRKSAFSVQFIEQYLQYCTNPNILTDLENIFDLPNYADFESHRHDQSVFSLLSKKYGLQGFRDPSQWGNNRIAEYSNSDYPQILEHTRQKSPKQAKFGYRLKRFFFPRYD